MTLVTFSVYINCYPGKLYLLIQNSLNWIIIVFCDQSNMFSIRFETIYDPAIILFQLFSRTIGIIKPLLDIRSMCFYICKLFFRYGMRLLLLLPSLPHQTAIYLFHYPVYYLFSRWLSGLSFRIPITSTFWIPVRLSTISKLMSKTSPTFTEVVFLKSSSNMISKSKLSTSVFIKRTV